MKGRLVYVVGPSGSGKDSVIDYARKRLPADAPVAFARRTITRPAMAGHEDHVVATQAEFDTLRAGGAFAMHWRANGLAYGIGREITGWLDEGRTVVVSGSREHLPLALADFPYIEAVLVTAPIETLRARLGLRGREDAARIEGRLARAATLAVPPGIDALVIANDGELAAAGEKLLAFLAGRFAPLSPPSPRSP